MEHRTITHSIITSIIVFLPFFTFYKTKAVPYFIALTQHSLIGDFTTGGTYGGGPLLLWPITSTRYGIPNSIFSLTNITLEMGSFLAAMIVILKTKDIKKLLKGKPSDLPLSIPILTVLLPMSLHFPLLIPPELFIPHLTYLILFTLSILAAFKSIQKKNSP